MRHMGRANPAAREALLDATERLIIAKGYAATTVDQICEKVGATKGTFFHYFESKEQIALAALERFIANRAQTLGSAGLEKEKDPLKRFDRLIEFATNDCRDPQRDSCLAGMLSQEMSATHASFRKMCRVAFRDATAMIKSILDDVKAAYAPRSKVDTSELAELFVAVCQGGLLMSKAKGTIQPLHSALAHYQSYVHSQLGEGVPASRRSKRG